MVRKVLMLVVIFMAYQFFKDYCFEQHRKLTNKEYISIVLNGLLKSGRMKVDDRDNTVKSYLAQHSNCCRVYRGIFFFDDTPTVDIIYEMSAELEKRINTSGKHLYYENVTEMTACGKPFHETGEAITAPINEIHSTH